MKEKDLRKYHRILGVVLAVFVLAQAGTGLYLTLKKGIGGSEHHGHSFTSPSISATSVAQANSSRSGAHRSEHEDDAMHHGTEYDRHSYSETSESTESQGLLSILHYGGGAIGMVYRLLLALGMIGLVLTGLFIYQKRSARG